MESRSTYLMIFLAFCITFILGALAHPVMAAGGAENNPERVRRAIERASSDRRFKYPEVVEYEIDEDYRDYEYSDREWDGREEPAGGGWSRSSGGGIGFGDVTFDISIMTYILYAVAVIALAFIIYRLVLYYHPLLRRGLIDNAGLGGEIFESLDPGGQLSLAEGLLRQGKWGEALSALMMSLLLTLDSRQLIRYHRSRTNREYLGNLRKHPILFTVAKEFVQNFEEMKFGHRQPDRDGVNYAFDLYHQAENSMPVVAVGAATPRG